MHENQKGTVPKFLYRYRRFADEYTSLPRILVNNEWYFGSRVDFDDQADCVLPGIILDRDHMRRMIIERDGSLTKAREAEIEGLLADPNGEQRTTAAVQSYVDRLGILCLSESPHHPELWKIYAEGGRGVVLCLETLKVAFAPKYLDRGPFEVSYSDNPKVAWDPRGDKTYQLAQTEDHLLRKGTRWQYQKEWRLIQIDDEEKITVGYHSMPPPALRAVIFGSRLSLMERNEIIQWIKAGPFKPSIVTKS